MQYVQQDLYHTVYRPIKRCVIPAQFAASSDYWMCCKFRHVHHCIMQCRLVTCCSAVNLVFSKNLLLKRLYCGSGCKMWKLNSSRLVTVVLHQYPGVTCNFHVTIPTHLWFISCLLQTENATLFSQGWIQRILEVCPSWCHLSIHTVMQGRVLLWNTSQWNDFIDRIFNWFVHLCIYLFLFIHLFMFQLIDV